MTIFDIGFEIGEFIRTHRVTYEGDFTDLAIYAIDLFKPFDSINLHSWEEGVVSIKDIPEQKHAGGAVDFGEPAITLYTSPDHTFFIEMYHWHSQNITIHDHAFSGAFCVVTGECSHEEFTYTAEYSLAGFQIGRLIAKRKVTLFPRDRLPIRNNRQLIHRNIHLSKPTITFIIRTAKDPNAVNYIYSESGIAMKPDLSEKGKLVISTLEGLINCNNQVRASVFFKKIMRSNLSCFEKFQAMEKISQSIDIELSMSQAGYLWETDDLLHKQALRNALENGL